MNKIKFLLLGLWLVGASTFPLHALKCGPFKAVGYSCKTQNVQAMLDAPNNLEYWQNPACLDLLITEVEKEGTKMMEHKKELIWKGFNSATTKWKTDNRDALFWLWADRKNYINYKMGDITANSTCSTRTRGENGCYAKDSPGCSIRVDGKDYPLATGEAIVQFMDANFPPAHSQREKAVWAIATKICMMKLNTLRDRKWAESDAYISLLRDMTSAEMVSNINSSLDKDNRQYDKCVILDELAKMKHFLEGKIPSAGGSGNARDLNVGPGASSNNAGNGRGGNGGGKPKPKPESHKISSFKVSAK